MPATTKTRPLPPAFREKAGKYLLLLSSDQAGEQAAAADALGRLLKSHGLDWHDLAQAIMAAPAAVIEPPRAKPPPKQPRQSNGDGEQVAAADLIALIESLRAACRFNARSEDFLDSLLERADRYDVVFLSPKMWRWLCDLVDQAGILMIQLPDLHNVDEIGFDGETYDPGLQQERGSSWAWGDGYICGAAIAWRKGRDIEAGYIPLRHPDTCNIPVGQFAGWMRDLVVNTTIPFTGQNLVYDFGWARKTLGVPMPPAERLYDVGVAASLINENHYSYSLDSLCQRANLPGKDEIELRQAVEAAGFKKGKPQEHIWQLPARYVAPYATRDAVAPLDLRAVYDPLLDAEGLRSAFKLDMAVLPVTLEMRLRGIRVDQDAAEQARDYCLGRRDAVLKELSAQHGKPVGMEEINGKNWKIKTFDTYGIKYPLTELGNPSFKAGRRGWMTQCEHWLPQGIIAARRYHDAAVKFLEGHILDHIVNGRVHAEIHSFRSDEGGARTSRFSYSDPPLQQIPKHDKELAPVTRKAFLPEEGGRWGTWDYKQQEFVHVIDRAVQHRLPGALAAAEAYCADPDYDVHRMVATLIGHGRDTAKGCNFGKIYGMGLPAFAQEIGRSVEETRVILAEYDRRLPYVWRLAKLTQDMAECLGYTEFGDGCRRHWNLYEAARVFAKGAGPCSLEEALRRRGDPNHPWYRAPLQRAGMFRALNAAIQGASARQTKQWMVDCHREGIVPTLTMHDALECSVATREQAELITQLGIDAVKLSIPMRIDQKFGASWGDAKHAWDDAPIATPTPTPVRAAAGARHLDTIIAKLQEGAL